MKQIELCDSIIISAKARSKSKGAEMIKGKLSWEFFVIPTIRIDWGNKDFVNGFVSITFEWLRWYIGFKITR